MVFIGIWMRFSFYLEVRNNTCSHPWSVIHKENNTENGPYDHFAYSISYLLLSLFLFAVLGVFINLVILDRTSIIARSRTRSHTQS